jgi:hypothetical protein
MAYKKIYDDMYGVDLLYFSNMSIDKIQKKANRVFNINEEICLNEEDAGGFFKCTTKDQRKIYIIWVKKARDVSILAHELIHLVFEVFKERGISKSHRNQESFAYYHTYWMDKIL